MTYSDIEKFYKNDKSEYDIKNNSWFLGWLINSLDDGVKLDFRWELEDFEKLIDYAVSWYELKYPGYILTSYYGNQMANNLVNVPNISNRLDGKQFLYRLPYRQKLLMRFDFSGNFYSSGYEMFENGKKVMKVGYLTELKDMKGNSLYRIKFDAQSGVIVDSNVSNFKGLTLEKLVSDFKKNKEEVDYSVLEKALKNYYFKIELRHKLLQLAALKILYKSKSEDMGFQTPDMGYMRAKIFINEFNEDFGLDLSSDEIDSLYSEVALGGRNVKLYKKS